jgi:TolB protein
MDCETSQSVMNIAQSLARGGLPVNNMKNGFTHIFVCILLTGVMSLGLAGKVKAAGFRDVRITSGLHNHFSPSISGGNIVWAEWGNGSYDIFMWNPVNGEMAICTDPRNQMNPSISGDKIVWSDCRNVSSSTPDNIDIYMWDPVNGERAICTYTGWQDNPAISGDNIVWQDKRNGNWDIYMWDPVNGERAICTDPAIQSHPAISGDKIVWDDDRNGNPDIYMWDPVDGERAVCTDPAIQISPAISGDTVVWQDYRNGYFDIDDEWIDNSDIYMWDPLNGERAVCTGSNDQQNPAISGNKIVWEDYRNGHYDREEERFVNSDIYMWDPIFEERAVCLNSREQWGTKIFGDKIVWMDNRIEYWDIYMAGIPGVSNIQGDINKDGIVNLEDLAIMSGEWMQEECWYSYGL